MKLTVALILVVFVLVRLFRPRVDFRRSLPGVEHGCGEMTMLVSYDSIRLRLEDAPHLSRARRNVMLAGYGWAEPREADREVI